jgi:DNA mismatch repair protein MutS
MEPVVDIGGGRHPVVEYHQRAGEFVDNTVVLDADPVRFALITGPNMAGKSTVLRQTALIAIMAHVGSFVPAEEALIGVCDRLFCRVGASDNIARGESTFLVEMNETSNILRNATDRSLVIMDEVGRGTSTHDGLAIAWAVSEHLLNRARCRTLFATHYHELARLKHPAFRAFGMAVDHSGGEIVFLKKLTEDPDNRSYGVDVARLAGLPEPVIARAREILTGLENGSTPSVVASEPHSPNRTGAAASAGELFSHGDLLAAELSAVDPDQLSPREALDLLYRWKSRVASED